VRRRRRRRSEGRVGVAGWREKASDAPATAGPATSL